MGKSSQGCAWEIGAPPTPFIDAQHGWTTTTKVRNVAPVTRATNIVAPQKAKQNMREGIVPAASSSNMTGPWETGNDPWANDKGLSSGISPPSQHVQQKIDDVERRLQDSVKAQVSASVEQIAFQINPDDGKDARMTTVENQVQALMRGQQALELWMQDGNTKINELRAEYGQMQQVVGQPARSRHMANPLHKLHLRFPSAVLLWRSKDRNFPGCQGSWWFERSFGTLRILEAQI